jgi:hypothetical protein
MKLYRLFAQSAELTHIEEMPPEEFAKLHDEWRSAKHWRFRQQPAGKFLDWHCADKKLVFALLAGKFELGAGDGKSAVLEPGDVCLIDDKGSRGHTGRVLSREPCEILHVEID